MEYLSEYQDFLKIPVLKEEKNLPPQKVVKPSPKKEAKKLIFKINLEQEENEQIQEEWITKMKTKYIRKWGLHNTSKTKIYYKVTTEEDVNDNCAVVINNTRNLEQLSSYYTSIINSYNEL